MIALVSERLPELHELCRRYRVARLALFGSATRDDFDPERSDLDFLVEFLPAGYREHADAYFGLLFALEDAFARKVDLIEYKAVRDRYFAAAVDRSQVPLYAAA